MCTPEALDALNANISRLSEDADLLQSGPFRVVFYTNDVTSEWAVRLRSIVDGLKHVALSNEEASDAS